jgi:hypothetical protein
MINVIFRKKGVEKIMQQLTIFDMFEEMKVAPVGETCLNCSRFNIIQCWDNAPVCFGGVITRKRIEPSMAACKDFKKSTSKVSVVTSAYGPVSYWIDRSKIVV